MVKLLIGTVIVAAVATLGDYIWYARGVQHQMAVGILHGALMLMGVGGTLGWPANRVVVGLGVGVAAGVLGAVSYYALEPALGYPAMFTAWVVVWLLLAFGEGRLLQTPARTLSSVLVRGMIAAVLSGVAFYAISGTVWGRAPAGGRNYLEHFAAWLVAFAPGLIAIGAPARTTAGRP